MIIINILSPCDLDHSNQLIITCFQTSFQTRQIDIWKWLFLRNLKKKKKTPEKSKTRKKRWVLSNTWLSNADLDKQHVFENHYDGVQI